MDVRGVVLRTVTAVIVGTTITACISATATAAPSTTGVPGFETLDEEADSEPARTALQVLAMSPDLDDVADEHTPFFYTAPTFGCGAAAPVTLTMASASANTVSFQALSAYPGVVTASGLNVVWINTTTGASGFDALDGTTEDGYPSLSAVADTGSGTVLAAIFGTVNYATAACHVLPTVGSFFVPEEGPMPAEAAATLGASAFRPVHG